MRALRFTAPVLMALTLLLVGCGLGEDGSSSEPTIPEVLSITPDDGDVHVRLWQDVTLRFNTPMDKTSVEDALSVTTPDKAALAYSTFWMGNILELEFDIDLEPGTVHTVTLGEQALSAEGEPLAEAFTSSFTSLPTHPVVIETYPPAGATDIPRNVIPMVRFSESMDEASTFAGIVVDPPDPHILAFNGYDLELDFDVDLLASTTYTITVPGSAEELVGDETLGEDYVFSFTTGGGFDLEGPSVVSYDPPNGATNVARDIGQIVIRFSEPVEELTLFEGIDLRIFGLVYGDPGLSPDRMTFTIPMLRLPSGVELGFDPSPFSDMLGNVGENPPPYSFTVTGEPDYFPADEGDLWEYREIGDEMGLNYLVRVENRSGQEFDMADYFEGAREFEEFDLLGEVRHYRRSADAIAWLGMEQGDYSAEFTTPIDWFRFPPTPGSTWEGSTDYHSGFSTVNVDYEFEIVGVIDFQPPVAMREISDRWGIGREFPDDYVYPDCIHVEFSYTLSVPSGDMWVLTDGGMQHNFYCPGVGLVYRHDAQWPIGGGPEDTVISETFVRRWIVGQ